MTSDKLKQSFANDIATLQQINVNAIVVHGGGPQINHMLEKLDVKTSFVDGLRVTDKQTVDVAEMVLAGSINKDIAAAISCAGGRALGVSGRDDCLVRVQQRDQALGFVGDPVEVRVDLLHSLLDLGITPVIAPIGADDEGAAYNVNADTMAGVIAATMGASNLFLLTDVAGVLDGSGNLMQNLSVADAQRLIGDGVAVGGMIPKLRTAMSAVQGGVESAVVMDGRVEHCVLEHLFGTQAVGTVIS